MRRLPRILFFGVALAFPLETMAEEPSPLMCDVGTIKVQEDRFSGRSEASTKLSLPPSNDLAPVLVWSSQLPDHLGLMFHGRFTTWKYLKCHTTFALIDGERLSLDPAEHDGEVISSGVIEQVITAFPWAEAGKLRTGRVFEYKICGDAFKASDAFLCEARDLIRSVEDWKKKSRPPG